MRFPFLLVFKTFAYDVFGGDRSHLLVGGGLLSSEYSVLILDNTSWSLLLSLG